MERLAVLLSILGCILFSTTGCKTDSTHLNSAPDMVMAAEKAMNALILVSGIPANEAIGDTIHLNRRGSGVLIDPDGYILTNFHVINNLQKIFVYRSDMQYYRAEIIGKDSLHDLALLKINGTNFPFLEFGDSDALKVGESVIGAGNPYNLEFTITSGIISALNRDLNVPGNEIREYIQTDVPTNSGNSGGPLLNAKGELIGIMGIIITASGQYEGYSLVSPSNVVQKIANDLKTLGKFNRGSVGITIRNVTPEIAQQAKMQSVTGIVVDALVDGGAADKAGVKSLDIILSVNGKDVLSTAQFLDLLLLYSPGETLNLVVNRDGNELNIPVVLNAPAG